MVELGHTPWDAARLVKELTAPELEAYARARAKQRRLDRHLEAVRMQWWATLLRSLLSYCVAEGYRMGRSHRAGSDQYERLPELDLKQWLDQAPGYDKKLVPKRRKRR